MFTLFTVCHIGGPRRSSNMAASHWALQFCAKHFAEYLNFVTTRTPQTWRAVFFIYRLQYENFLNLSTTWFLIAWQCLPKLEPSRNVKSKVMRNRIKQGNQGLLAEKMRYFRAKVYFKSRRAPVNLFFSGRSRLWVKDEVRFYFTCTHGFSSFKSFLHFSPTIRECPSPFPPGPLP